ncbi:MAG TPA: TetR family transcriptional regulator [Cellulomonas sp.]
MPGPTRPDPHAAATSATAAHAPAPAAPAAPRGRTGLTREAVVRAARRIVEAEGADALSMRRLAAALDSRPMTLYHYVSGRSELLNAVLDEIAGELRWQEPTGEATERMLAIAVEIHRVLAGLPWVVSILQEATHVGAPALVGADRFVAAAYDAGAGPAQALALWRSVWFLLSGDLVLAQRSAAAAESGTGRWYETIDTERLPDAPVIRALLPRWAELSADYDLTDQLRLLIGAARGSWLGSGASGPPRG